MVFQSTAPLDNASTALIIWGVCIGVVLGFIYNFVSRWIAGSFVRALLSQDCVGQSKAISLKDAGFLGKKALHLLLADGSSIRRIIGVVGGTIPVITQGKRTKKDFESAKFYIIEESKDKASVAFGQKDKWYYLVLFIVLAVGCAYGMTKVMPLLMEGLF